VDSSISVIIPACRAEPFIRRAVESVLRKGAREVVRRLAA
jgi:hypothetical protein